MKQSIDEIVEALNGKLLGSRALGIAKEDADYDIACMKEDLTKELRVMLASDDYFDIRRYFKVLPLHNTYMLRKVYIGEYCCDIIIFTNKSDYNSISKAIDVMKTLPKCLYEEKHDRIRNFELILKSYCWNRDFDYFKNKKKGVEDEND